MSHVVGERFGIGRSYADMLDSRREHFEQPLSDEDAALIAELLHRQPTDPPKTN